MKICMFVKNSFEFDARVEREARTLAGEGHEVTVVALLVEGVTPDRMRSAGGFEVVRVRSARLGLGRVVRWLARSGVPSPVPPSTAAPGRDHEQEPATRAAGGLLGVAARSVALAVRMGRRLLRVPTGGVKTIILDRRMARAGRATGAAVFHAHDLNTLVVAVRCARDLGARVVYDSHELAADRSRMTRWGRLAARRSERRLLRRVDALIVASPPWIRILRDRYPAAPQRAITVVNAPELREPQPADLHALAGLSRSVPIVLYQGSIQEHRGIEPAIEAMRHLEDLALVVMGYGHHRPFLEQMAHDLGLHDRVRFIGPVPHERLIDHTAAAAVGLCNIVSSSLSYHTSLPNKLFEYLMAGVPVIGSEGPEIARILEETGAGVVVAATDPDAIAGAVRQILADRPRFVALAQQARLTHHWAPEGEKLVALYRELAT